MRVLRRLERLAPCTSCALLLLVSSVRCPAQETPLISGGAGFLTSTNGGNTTYLPIIEPLIMVPLGPRVQIESRAAILDSIFHTPGTDGYDTQHFAGLTYLQTDVFLNKHITLVAGSYLIPFGTYNERLSPVWIGNFQSGPLIAGMGMGTGSGLGGQIRGSAISKSRYSIDYAAFFSARSGNEQFGAQRSFGGRSSLYLPEKRLEIGLSYERVLQGTRENFYGGHMWWEPPQTNLRIRGEFARGHHAQGYWIEFDYRAENLARISPWLGRFEPVFRMQQTWRRDTVVSDTLPLVNTVRPDFGIDYNLPHNTRILTSYSRQFGHNANVNIWQTGIVYRFLFPAWPGKR